MPAQGCWILGGNNMNIHFSEHSCYAELQNWSSSMVIFIRHDKLLFNTYIEKCWEIRPESLFQWSRLNLHTWRHLSGKITVLPSAWIPLIEYETCWVAYIHQCMGFSTIWHIFKHIKLHVFFVHSCWACKSPDKCLHHNTEGKAFIFYFLQCSLCQHCTLAGGSGCLVRGLCSSAIEDLDAGNNLRKVHRVNLTKFFTWTVPSFSTWKFCTGGFCQLPIRAVDVPMSLSAGRLDRGVPSQAAPQHCLLQCSQDRCAMCRCAAPSHGMCLLVSQPDLCSQGLQAGSPPAAAECPCFPGTLSHLRVLTPTAGPQAHQVLACSETDVERSVFRVVAIFVWSICSTACFPAVSYSLK